MTNSEANSGLYHRVYEIGNLQSAWARVEESDGCAGIDGVTLERFAENLDAELANLGHELGEGSYRPLPAAQFFVPKRGGGQRRLCVLAVRDRVAQHAVINVIRPRIEAEFEDVSYAYRRGRSVKQALDQVERLRDAGYQWVVDADISSYFENVDSELLLGRVRELIEDERVVGVIEQWIAAFVYDGKEMARMSKGLPQGAPISPMPANLYLDAFDDRMLADDQRGARSIAAGIERREDPRATLATARGTDSQRSLSLAALTHKLCFVSPDYN